MILFESANRRVRAAAFAALAAAALALFLFTASNILLLGLRAHDGGFHFSEIAASWRHYGADKRLDRWLTLSTLAGLIVSFGLAGAVLRRSPPPLHGKASSPMSATSRPRACAPGRACCWAGRITACFVSAALNMSLSMRRPAPAKASAM
jgi:hypothetical protein